MKTMHHLAALAALAGLSAMGCDPFSDFCEQWASCESKSDHEEEVCVLDANAEEERAAVKGCTDQFDQRVDCLDESSACDENRQLWQRSGPVRRSRKPTIIAWKMGPAEWRARGR